MLLFQNVFTKKMEKNRNDARGLVKKEFKNQPSYWLQRHETELSQTVTS